MWAEVVVLSFSLATEHNHFTARPQRAPCLHCAEPCTAPFLYYSFPLSLFSPRFPRYLEFYTPPHSFLLCYLIIALPVNMGSFSLDTLNIKTPTAAFLLLEVCSLRAGSMRPELQTRVGELLSCLIQFKNTHTLKIRSFIGILEGYQLILRVPVSVEENKVLTHHGTPLTRREVQKRN